MGGVVSFLKKAGTVLINAVSIVELGYPVLGKLLPKGVQGTADLVVTELEQMAGTVTSVEMIGNAIPAGLTGEQKFAAVLPAIARIVAQSSVMAGKKIADNALFQKAVNGYAQATVDMLQSLDPSAVVVK